MNWITNYVKPTLRAITGQKTDTPDALWTKCPSCEQMVFQRDLVKNLHVCPHCEHHLRMTAAQRLDSLYDNNTYTLIPLPQVPEDPIKFKDTKKYTDRLKAYREKTGLKDAVVVAQGTIGGETVITCVFDFHFMGGSMGMAVGEALIKGATTAVRLKCPLLVLPASGGARMQEGPLSLMQLPRTMVAVEMVRDARLPYVVLLTDPTTGGVSASFAMVGDITIAEPKCLIGFAGRRVIEETIREKLPENFQTSEYLLEHGMIDQVLPRAALKSFLSTLFRLLRKNR